MTAVKETKKHLTIALKEIGGIKPRFNKKFKVWVFSHAKYPVEYGGDSPAEVIKNYPLYLRDFLEERLNSNLAPHVEKATKGRGGIHPAAHR